MKARIKNLIAGGNNKKNQHHNKMKTENTGVIFVIVPHQTMAQAYEFENEKEFLSWARRTRDGERFSWETFDRDGWDAEFKWALEEDDDPQGEVGVMLKEHALGVALFNSGAKRIVRVSEDGHTSVEPLGAETEARRMAAWLGHDCHAWHLLDYNKATQVIAGKRMLGTHQQGRVLKLVHESAERLGWIAEEVNEEVDE